MSIHGPFPPHDEARWQAQERARRGDPDAEAGDRRLARALRHPPPVALPHDFARQVAAMARAQAASSSLLEQRLLRGLVLVLAVSAAVMVAWHGRGWAASLASVLPGGTDAAGWGGVALLCVCANWGFGALRRRADAPPHAAG